MKTILISTLLVLLPMAAHAELTVNTAVYTCENGTDMAVSYVGNVVDSLAVLTHDGVQMGLAQQISASGAKFAPAPGEIGIVWWTKGDEASLYIQGKVVDQDVLITTCTVKK